MATLLRALLQPGAFPTDICGVPLVVSTHARARRMTMKLCTHSRTLRLTLPPRTAQRRALAWLAEQRPWMEHQVANRLPPAIPFRPGTSLPFGDGQILLASGRKRRIEHDRDRLLVAGDDTLFAGRVRRWLAAEAVRRFAPQTHALASQIGQTVEKVSAGDWRSRWGACGQQRITYSWRLLMAPAFVQEALIAHEVAHLREHHHGPEFWRLATKLLGGPHMPARRWLNKNGPLLHSYGAER